MARVAERKTKKKIMRRGMNVDMPAKKVKPAKGTTAYEIQQEENKLKQNFTKFASLQYDTVGQDGFLYSLLPIHLYNLFSIEKAKAFPSLRRVNSNATRKPKEFWPDKAHGVGLPSKHLRLFDTHKKPLKLTVTKRIPLRFKYSSLEELNALVGTKIPNGVEEMKSSFDRRMQVNGVDPETREKVINHMFSCVDFQIFYTAGGYRRPSSCYLEVQATLYESEAEVANRLARVKQLRELIKQVEKEDKELKNVGRKIRNEARKKEQKEIREAQRKREQFARQRAAAERKRTAKQKIDAAVREVAVTALADRLSGLTGKALEKAVNRIIETLDKKEQPNG